VTSYDREQFQRYIRLLDAKAAGMSEDDMCRTILDIDPDTNRLDALRVLSSHLNRAIWMSKTGYRAI